MAMKEYKIEDLASTDEYGHQPNITLHSLVDEGKEPDIEIMLGYRSIILNKIFGPTVFANIRITSAFPGITVSRDSKFIGWIIERECIHTGEYTEVCRIEAQNETDYPKEEEEDAQ